MTTPSQACHASCIQSRVISALLQTCPSVLSTVQIGMPRLHNVAREVITIDLHSISDLCTSHGKGSVLITYAICVRRPSHLNTNSLV